MWICRDADGALYYQGLTATNGVFTDTNSILVPHVEDEGDDTYVAVNQANNGTWKYTASRTGLVVQRVGGATTTERAVAGG